MQGSRPGSGPQLWPALQAFGARGDTESPRCTSLSGESPSPPRLSCLGEKAVAPAASVALGVSTPLGAQGLGVPFSLRQLGESRGAEGGEAALAAGQAASLLRDRGHQPRGLAHVARLSQ